MGNALCCLCKLCVFLKKFFMTTEKFLFILLILPMFVFMYYHITMCSFI